MDVVTTATTTAELMTGSNTNEWGTCDSVIKAARELFGEIDLDPASSGFFNAWVQANRIYTQAEDGYKRFWHGRIFLNPPYGKRNKFKGVYGARQWVLKAIEEYRCDRVSEAIIVIRDSNAKHPLVQEFASCEPTKRLVYRDGKGQMCNSPQHNSVIYYLGNRVGKFANSFCHLGAIRVPYSNYVGLLSHE